MAKANPSVTNQLACIVGIQSMRTCAVSNPNVFFGVHRSEATSGA
jgi:hypothetical protein